MSTFADIRANLESADELLKQIEADYTASLKKQHIDAKLSVRIKNYLENLRSPLDYIAKDICTSRLGLKSSHKTYFPIACENDASFNKHVAKNLPNLDTVEPSLYNTLRDCQAYQPNGCKALPRLSRLVNENKHNRLTPQTRQEKRGLTVNFPGGASISMGPGASISGGGVISSGGGAISPASGSISGDSPAQSALNVQQTVTVWVSFHFTDTSEDVLTLLKKCRDDVNRIVTAFKPLLWA